MYLFVIFTLFTFIQSPQLGETKLSGKYLYKPNSLVDTDKILVKKSVQGIYCEKKNEFQKKETVIFF